MIEKINKWPVVILSNYRTGSTAYATQLSKQLGVPNYLEPFQPSHLRKDDYGEHVEGIRIKYYNHLKSNDTKYVLKIMPDQISELTPYESILATDCYKIRLYRENELDNVVSHYISTVRGKWWTTTGEIATSYTVDVNIELIRRCIYIISHNNHMLRNLGYKYDQSISYESLNLPSDDFIKTYMPDNITELKEAVTQIYTKIINATGNSSPKYFLSNT